LLTNIYIQNIDINITKYNIIKQTMASEIFVSKETLKRIISDVKEIRKNPLSSHGIYYEHDDTNMLKGRALIIGPSDTPYEDGFYLFRFQFPTNYPHSPPKVDFCTSDGYTRFNPNLYRTGKVCLSILNTWQGEPWSGCQTLTSVLLALCTVLNTNPLLNEPGITKHHADLKNYNEIIKYKNIEVAIFKMMKNVGCNKTINKVETSSKSAAKGEEEEPGENEDNVNSIISDFSIFGEIMNEHFQKNKEKIRKRLEDAVLSHKSVGVEHYVGVYKMTVFVDYNFLLKRISLF
jgi:ubiquitin-conjugating enzyme E2 Z